MRKKVYIAAGATTVFFGPGRKEFNPKKEMPSFEQYLQETSDATCHQLSQVDFDEGIIGSFMSGRFLKQANLPGFLPFMVPSLLGKPCTGIEGACGTGGRSIATGVKSILSDLSDAVFVSAFEMQNTVKSVYGADILAGAGYYKGMRKQGHAYYFPGVFSDRAGAYFEKYGREDTWRGMAKWYELQILNARKNPKAQEYHNHVQDLFAQGLTPPDPERFLPYLNTFHCSKVTDGAASLGVFSESGLKKCGIEKSQAVEIIGMGAAEGNITLPPPDKTALSITKIAVTKALENAGLTLEDIGVLEVHDCFAISGLLSLEAAGFAKPGKSSSFVLDGNTTKEGTIPTNLSGGLGGFGHPTGASGVRQMVDLLYQLTGKAANQANLRKPFGMMISMGGDDITVTCFIVRSDAV